MVFKEYVEEILKTEILRIIGHQGYVLETEICTVLCEKYNISFDTLRATLRSIYPDMLLLKRRITNELKIFYGLKVKGCPVVYLPIAENRK